MDKLLLNTAWDYSLIKIHSKEVIKNALDIGLVDTQALTIRLDFFDKDAFKVFKYLNSDFDVSKFKFRDENIERRFRHLLANKYLLDEINKIAALTKQKDIKKGKFLNFVANNLFLIIILLSITSFFIVPTLVDRLTPVDVLAQKIHEKSKYKFNGAICNDGWTSHSQGRGTCSYHEGVAYYFDKGDYSKSIEQCRIEAMNISWFVP